VYDGTSGTCGAIAVRTFLRTLRWTPTHGDDQLKRTIDTRDEALQVQFTTTSDHSFYATVRNNFDRLVKPFVLPHNVIIPAARIRGTTSTPIRKYRAAFPGPFMST
jgi:hypothetical protein